MYGPIEELAEELEIPKRIIEERFQEQYKNLVENDKASNAYLFSLQTGIDPTEQTLADIFRPYTNTFVEEEEDYDTTWDLIKTIKGDLHKDLPQTTLEYLTKELIKNNETEKIKLLTKENGPLPIDTVINALIEYVEKNDGENFIGLYDATSIKIPDKDLETIYKILAKKGKIEDIKTLDDFFTTRKRGKGYAEGVLDYLGLMDTNTE